MNFLKLKNIYTILLQKMKNDKFYGSYYELEVGRYLVKKIKDKNFIKIFYFFINKIYLDKYIKKEIKSNYSVLNIGVGFLSDFNLYRVLKKKIMIIDCSKDLISVSKKIIKKVKINKINLINKDIFKFKNKKKFDYVVCANLINVFKKEKQKKLIKKLSILSSHKIQIEVVNFYSFYNILYTLLRFNFFKIIFGKSCEFLSNIFNLKKSKDLTKLRLGFFLQQFSHSVPNKRYYYNADFYKTEFLKYNFYPKLVINSFSRQIFIFEKTNL